MFFELNKKKYFGAIAGAYSLVTADEASNSQLTLDECEKNICLRILRDRIPRGAVSEKGFNGFKVTLENSGKEIDLKFNYPKAESQELRLYLDKDKGFSPTKNDTWFIYEKAGHLHVGFLKTAQWDKQFGTLLFEPESDFKTVCSFLKEYKNKKEDEVRGRPEHLKAQESLKNLKTWIEEITAKKHGALLAVKDGFGSGRVIRTPYICLLPPKQTVGKGVYVSVCFGRNGDGAVSGCARSTNTKTKEQPIVRLPSDAGFIDVDGSRDSTKFNNTFFNPKSFYAERVNCEELKTHILESIPKCLSILNMKGAENMKIKKNDLLEKFSTELDKTGFQYEDSLPERLILSALAKPFIILTGNSGTGKTKIAEYLALWLGTGDRKNYEIVAVGADWTDNRNVIGFVNFLRDKDKKPLYQKTKILDLILRAKENPEYPFFLILDEMNLSHVERYFSDFLSAMESTSGEISLHDEMGSIPASGVDGQINKNNAYEIPRTVKLPKNLFILGTVNVDETTYMFSPKVLDRSNVIEFNISGDSFSQFLAETKLGLENIETAQESLQKEFVSLSQKARAGEIGSINDHPSWPDIEKAIRQIFEIMEKDNQEFGFRTINEILRYLSLDLELGGYDSQWQWQDSFDVQILQKVLPKIHGSRRKLEGLLSSLQHYCLEGQKPDKVFSDMATNDKKPIFALSHRKLTGMINILRRDQFVSFIH